MAHPRDILLGAQAAGTQIPVCDHYSGVELRMRKSLQLQAEMTEEFGACVFDVTLDCEDGAPVGGEADHAQLVVELALAAAPKARVGVRVHPVDHPSFGADIATIAGKAGHKLTHIMIPKVETPADVETAVRAIDAAGARDLPVQVLLESPGSQSMEVQDVPAIAAAASNVRRIERRCIASTSSALAPFARSQGTSIWETGSQQSGVSVRPAPKRP